MSLSSPSSSSTLGVSRASNEGEMEPGIEQVEHEWNFCSSLLMALMRGTAGSSRGNWASARM